MAQELCGEEPLAAVHYQTHLPSMLRHARIWSGGGWREDIASEDVLPARSVKKSITISGLRTSIAIVNKQIVTALEIEIKKNTIFCIYYI